jgi:hypothetical protein
LYTTAAWLRRADLNRSLPQFLKLPLEPEERQLGNVETNWFMAVVFDEDVTIYGAGHVGGSVPGNSSNSRRIANTAKEKS